jgi:hypothetical protein
MKQQVQVHYTVQKIHMSYYQLLKKESYLLSQGYISTDGSRGKYGEDMQPKCHSQAERLQGISTKN